MAEEGSYEIMPYKEIVQLKKQIAELQQKTGDTSSKELLNSMAALTKSMNNMLQLFSSAAEEMKLEEKTESELSQKVAPLIDKVDRLEEQNKTIAEGLVAVADMVKDLKGGRRIEPIKKAPKPPEPSFGGLPPLGEELPPLEPPRPTGGPPPFPPHGSPRIVTRRPMPPPGAPMPPPGPPPGPMPPGGMPPPGMPPRGGPDLGPLPPLPPLEEPKKKKGIFGLFKRK